MKEREKKKVKIISEKINTPFKEIKKDKKDDNKEEDEEQEIDNFEEGYEDISSGRRVTPVLQESGARQSVEARVANAPSVPESRKDGRNYEEITNVYNMPDYGGSKNYENERSMEQEKLGIGRSFNPLDDGQSMNSRERQERFLQNYPESKDNSGNQERRYEPKKSANERRAGLR